MPIYQFYKPTEDEQTGHSIFHSIKYYLQMKKPSLSKLENKYYYGFSRTFWHILVGTATIGVIVALSVVAYTYLPTSKKEVVKQEPPQKPAYPKQAEVSLAEILAVLPKEAAPKQQNEAIIDEGPIVQNTIQIPKEDNKGLTEFEQELSRLKNLIPPTEFNNLWNGSGDYVIIDQARWAITKSEQYRKWVPTSLGLRTLIIDRTLDLGFKSFSEKALLVNKYYEVLKNVNKENRPIVMDKLVYFKDTNLEKTLSSLQALANSIGVFPDEDKVSAYISNARFLQKNYNDGEPLLEYETKVLTNFDVAQRHLASVNIKTELQKNYNNNIPGIQENTDYFLKLLPSIEKDKQALALNYYYSLYTNKNQDRLITIRDIENQYARQLNEIELQYQNEVAAAEMAYQLKKVAKKTMRLTSAQAIAVGIGVVLFITIILLLLSMVRNVNRLAQAMLENNNKNNLN
ncbi:MAG: hypothetical protein KDC91_07615 [Flavobacteriaceae bacterium]|nr:hypothetical protein [Flavobacteriaceae bacterium]